MAINTGIAAPDFELPSIEGKPFSLKDALSRGPVLAAFFKVSCPTCQYTFPFIERLHQLAGNGSVQIWGISQDSREETEEFCNTYGISFPVLLDENSYTASNDYGLHFVPTLFLIGNDGEIQLMSEGFCKADLLELQSKLKLGNGSGPNGSGEELFKAGENVPEFRPG